MWPNLIGSPAAGLPHSSPPVSSRAVLLVPSLAWVVDATESSAGAVLVTACSVSVVSMALSSLLQPAAIKPTAATAATSLRVRIVLALIILIPLVQRASGAACWPFVLKNSQTITTYKAEPGAAARLLRPVTSCVVVQRQRRRDAIDIRAKAPTAA
jgi:hypothetical protein